MNILKKFAKENTNHFILVSRNYILGVKDASDFNLDVLCLKKDAPLGTMLDIHDNKNLKIRSLNIGETKFFKKNKENYRVVESTEDGRVYELVDNPFKPYYEDSLRAKRITKKSKK